MTRIVTIDKGRRVFALLLLPLLASCGLTQAYVEAGVACETDAFVVDDQFDGARRGACRARRNQHVDLTIVPEDEPPINDSAWFAFRLLPKAPTTAHVTLFYRDGRHRYWPKISRDGRTWRPLAAEAVTLHRRGRRMALALPLDAGPLWVAGQEIVTPSAIDDWARSLAARSGSQYQLLGRSVENRPLHVLRGNPSAKEAVLFVGRQHPPEVTGLYGMQGFVDAVFGDTPLARRFRERFDVIVVPVMNPDGIVHGHWRHNLGGTDLNRDWGPFAQPETGAVKALIDELEADGRQLRLFLDFHSTRRNVFYTQSDEDVTRPEGFADRWLNAARAAVRDYPFEIAKRHNRGLPTSKNYIYARFGIPAITYEVADRTSRSTAHAAARVFADEMMRILVASNAD